ncbi:uncharacterized protein C8Q71DRAFT_208155 [Rhodofomes roseus]|uniref:Uncharacterized protein n=1 Tax=Rhodofomes roseus TaxID=34475 RepID=A0ABQ8KTZ2_9APHY|nr:uncharacterized protein C8Q71DRAFT_208155 [Rhodofomes roseus]KAH9842552.1 hypothetical protein C8Q71DRAFT_208155 [Rhodofomes roseus]
MSQLPTCVLALRPARQSAKRKKYIGVVPQAISRSVLRIAVELALSVGIFLLCVLLTRRVLGISSLSTTTYGDRASAIARPPSEARPSGRWELFQRSLDDAGALSDSILAMDITDWDILLDMYDEPEVHIEHELRKRDYASDVALQQPLHFSLDSVQEDAHGRDVVTTPQNLVASFRQTKTKHR